MFLIISVLNRCIPISVPNMNNTNIILEGIKNIKLLTYAEQVNCILYLLNTLKY